MTLVNSRARVRYLLGELTSDNYSDANINTAVNNYYYQAMVIAIRASGHWDVSSDIATDDITANQQEYPFPTSLITIKKIEANFLGGDKDWVTLDVFDERGNRVISNDNNEDARTAINRCTLYDGSIFLEYKPLSTISEGIKIWYSKEATALSADDSEPNLPEHLNDYLVYGACVDYSLRTKDYSAANTFKSLLLEKEKEIKNHYSNIITIDKPRLIPKIERYN